MRSFCIAVYALVLVLLASCNSKKEEAVVNLPFWKEYDVYSSSEKLIDPKGYIDYLKEYVFTNHELDSLPVCAIILHDTRIGDYLSKLSFTPDEIDTLQTGTTDPNVLYVIRSSKQDVDFIISSGLPGTGGVSTQIAELGALGVKYVVHIGTCGILGEQIGRDTLIVSSGSYKDGGSVLISGNDSEVAFPDQQLSAGIMKMLEAQKTNYVSACGFTVPVFYFQPKTMISRLLKANDLTSKDNIPRYVEMEGAAVFVTASLVKMQSASLQAGTDRYTLKNDSIFHAFIDYDYDQLKREAVRASISTFKKLKK